MGVIKRLDPSLANKIAAGEVVERPASVVKELIENAIDAHADTITVEIEEGGMKTISIRDNGEGMAPEDCRAAFERHATSKIHSNDDLFRIRTLGFRGEALPSIAAVSYLEMKTSDGSGAGTHLMLQGGHLIQSGHSDSRRGTEIKVTRLFYNTPARLKYLKSVHTEMARISDVVNRMALSYPDIRFVLKNDGKVAFQTNGSGRLAHVLSTVYGVRTAKASIPFSGDSLDFHVEGLAVHPQISRAGRQYVYIFINNRYIRNYPIFNSIMNGYHTLLMVGRYPICVIHIRMNPSLVDVNVHPAKLEVRISKEKALCELIEQTIRRAFHRERLIPAVNVDDPKTKTRLSEQQSMDFSKKVKTGPDLADEGSTRHPSQAGRLASEKTLPSTSEVATTAQTNVHESGLGYEHEESAGNESEAAYTDSVDDSDVLPRKDGAVPAEPSHRMPKLHPIGQMHGTYIFAENEDGLYIIDQHAAQERINYEYYREKVGEQAPEVQELLVPMTFEFTASEYETIMDYHDYLKEIGLNFEPFGTDTLIVRAHPTWMPKGKESQLIEDIVQQLIESGNISIKKLRNRLAMTMACKRAIKANHHLRPDEIEALLDALAGAEDPFTCPHGRPVLVHFTTYEMEKMFKRVQ
jgi:DNA mismatch repair protein MutL